MSTINSKSAKEVNVILNFLSKEDYDKIPKEIIERLKENEDNVYQTKINSVEEIKESNMLNETRYILSYLFLNYLSNDEERVQYREIIKQNEIRAQNMYSIEKVFEKRRKSEKIIKKTNENVLPILKKENILKTILFKIVKKIKNLTQTSKNML